jgi:uncharacterized membrane protein YhaH (DUF805 family)
MDPQAIIEVFRRNVTQHYFDMKGRVRRQEFWHFVLACVVIDVVAFILEAIIRRRVLTPIIGLALLLPIAGLGARRLQDTGKNGVLILAYTIPTAILEVVSLLGAYGPYGMSGSLYFIFRLMGLVWLIAVVCSLTSGRSRARPVRTGMVPNPRQRQGQRLLPYEGCNGRFDEGWYCCPSSSVSKIRQGFKP